MRKISKKAFNLMKVCFVLLAVLVCGVYYLVFADELVPEVSNEISFEITIEETEKELISKEIKESATIIIDDIDYQEKNNDIDSATKSITLKNEKEELDNNYDKVDINTASSDLLQTLKNIGPVVAENIVNYRENVGRFDSIEDIMKVKGIGEGKFNAIKDSIVVND